MVDLLNWRCYGFSCGWIDEWCASASSRFKKSKVQFCLMVDIKQLMDWGKKTSTVHVTPKVVGFFISILKVGLIYFTFTQITIITLRDFGLLISGY